MDYKLELRKRAVYQMKDSHDYYESRSRGLGKRFIETVEKFIQNIKDHPKHYPVKRESIREAYIKDFPFEIVFEILDKTIIIYSVFSHKSRSQK